MPVYNAAPYISQAIESILAQTYPNWELIICDNQSTDLSAEIAQTYAVKDERIRFFQNQWNIGFSGNAHKTVSLAQGDFLLLHAADDVSSHNALAMYVDAISRFNRTAGDVVLLSDFEILNQSGQRLGAYRLDNLSLKFDEMGQATILDDHSTTASHKISEFEGHTILKEKLLRLSTFGWVGTVLFSRKLRDKTEGYYSNHWVNPDKHFMFKLLSLNPSVIWIHDLLFAYRLHDFNQNSQQLVSGVLKYLVDQYAFTFELPSKMLNEVDIRQESLIHHFVEYDCIRPALREIALGRRKSGFRHLCFGLATYPDIAFRSLKTYAAMALWLLGPLGTVIASRAYAAYVSRNSYRFHEASTFRKSK